MDFLPEAFREFSKYPQFLLWRTKVLEDGRATKIPIDPSTLLVTNAHNPKSWVDYNTAIHKSIITGLGVAFAFTPNDPFFFLDLDKCKDDKGNWNILSVQLCNIFAGAAIEVSQSGNGLHIFGKFSGDLKHKCKNTPLKLELYTEGRFVALTGVRAMGDAGLDCTTQLTDTINNYFASDSAPESKYDKWTDIPCEDWEGPTDDDILISKMFSTKTVANLFGSKASVQDLWEVNEDVLSKVYPPITDSCAFDRSTADLALCSHLSFWTGKDCARIDRLFRQSGLMRDKWNDRDDYYKHKTIFKAVGGCTAVYNNQSKKNDEVVTAPENINNKPFLKSGYQYKSPDQQLALFKDCAYIRDVHRILTADGSLLKSEQFRVVYGGWIFALDSSNDKTTTNAWEAFTESQAIGFPKVHTQCFRPELKPLIIISEENRLVINTYVPIETRKIPGDVTPFLTHLCKVLPVEADRGIILAYMAACVQHIGVKFQWAPVLQGIPGNGKTIFIDCLTHAIGTRYTHLPNAKDLGGNGSKFTAWLQNKLFIGVEEISTTDKSDVANALKPLITNPRVEIQGKGADQVTGDNRANFFMCCNPKDAITKHKSDRRYCVFYTAQQRLEDLDATGMGGSYFPVFQKWLKEDGYAIVAHYLQNYAIPAALNPADACHRAPINSSTELVIAMSTGRIEQEVAEAVEAGRAGFCAPWISSIALDNLLKDIRANNILSHKKRGEFLAEMGYIPHPGLKDGRVNNMTLIDGGKPRLYIKKDHIHINLLNPSEITKNYESCQSILNNSVDGGVNSG